jgi:hypothetical protein
MRVSQWMRQKPMHADHPFRAITLQSANRPKRHLVCGFVDLRGIKAWASIEVYGRKHAERSC